MLLQPRLAADAADDDQDQVARYALYFGRQKKYDCEQERSKKTILIVLARRRRRQRWRRQLNERIYMYIYTIHAYLLNLPRFLHKTHARDAFHH